MLGLKRVKAKNVPPEEYVYIIDKNFEESISKRYKYLLNILAKMFEFDAKEIGGKSRVYPLPVYRAMAWCVLRNDGYSYIQIGKVANRNHATIILLTKKLLDGLKFDKELTMKFEVFKANVDKSLSDINVYYPTNYNFPV